MTASRQRVLFARCMGALVTLFGGGAVTLGCSFMVIRSGDVCFFGHRGVPLLPWLLHEGAQQAEMTSFSCADEAATTLIGCAWCVTQRIRYSEPFGPARQNHQCLK